MLEFKLIATTILGKPKLGIVPYSIQAEPGAKRGIWLGASKEKLDDMFIICLSLEEAVNVINKLNIGVGATISIDIRIQEYLQTNKPTHAH